MIPSTIHRHYRPLECFASSPHYYLFSFSEIKFNNIISSSTEINFIATLIIQNLLARSRGEQANPLPILLSLELWLMDCWARFEASLIFYYRVGGVDFGGQSRLTQYGRFANMWIFTILHPHNPRFSENILIFSILWSIFIDGVLKFPLSSPSFCLSIKLAQHISSVCWVQSF